MYSRQHHHRRSSVLDFRLGRYSQARGFGPIIYNARAAWSDAEIFVNRQLRMGCHPVLLERDIESVLSDLGLANRDGYRYQCLIYAQRILVNLRISGQFDGLPTYIQLEQINLARPRRARYQMMMYDRFRNFEEFSRCGRDVDIAREIARARALDREAEEELRKMREQDRTLLEEQYKANEASLRGEPSDATFWTELMGPRLPFDQQQTQRGGVPAAGYHPLPNQYNPIPPSPPMPQPSYAAPETNGGNQYNQYPDNQMLYGARGIFQDQHPYQPNPYQPNQYQRPPGEDNWPM